jgi:hypothetical protein
MLFNIISLKLFFLFISSLVLLLLIYLFLINFDFF